MEGRNPGFQAEIIKRFCEKGDAGGWSKGEPSNLEIRQHPIEEDHGNPILINSFYERNGAFLQMNSLRSGTGERTFKGLSQVINQELCGHCYSEIWRDLRQRS